MGDYSEACAGNRRSSVNEARSHGSALAYPDTLNEVGSVVRDGLSANEQMLSELHETISRLEGRLDPTLSPVPPQPAGTTSTVPSGPPRSHVANRLAALHDGYGHAVGRLQELIRRVEV